MKTILKVDLKKEYVREILGDAAWAVEYAIDRLGNEDDDGDCFSKDPAKAWARALGLLIELRDQTDREE